MKLRIYQNGFVQTIAEFLTRVRKLVAQLATGGGKTVVFAAICNRYLKKSPDKTVVIIVHRKELLNQTRNTCYHAFGITCQPVIAGMKFIPKAQVYVCMVETVNKILNKPGGIKKLGNVGILIIDECHRLEFMKIHDHFKECFIIGFSATPVTASKKKPLKNYYEDIVCGVDIPHLISDGHLCQNITRAPKETVDRLKLKMKGNEFDESLMATEFSKVKYIHNTVKKYEEFAKGTKTIVFNVNIAHSIEVTKAFVDAGYNCKHVDGEMNDKQRDAIFKWFHDHHDAILCNVGIATTGFDEPTIENVIVNKSTASMPLWLQMTGRGSRPIDIDFIVKYQSSYPYQLTPKTMFNIIDMGGNAITHGDWCQSRDWYDLFHNPLKPGKNTIAPIKVCVQCEAVIAASARTCPLCGYVYPAKSIPVEDDLHEFIVVTKNIDVEKVINDNKERKEYYQIYSIATILANEAKSTVAEMKDEYAEFILTKYYEFVKAWMKRMNDTAPPHVKKKMFNKWQQQRFREHLFDELKIVFPGWQTQLIKPKQPYIKQSSLKMQPMQQNIEVIKQLHYQ